MVKWRITTPKNLVYDGVTAGVNFHKGEAIVENENLKNVLTNDYGYEAEEIKEPKPKAELKKSK